MRAAQQSHLAPAMSHTADEDAEDKVITPLMTTLRFVNLHLFCGLLLKLKIHTGGNVGGDPEEPPSASHCTACPCHYPRPPTCQHTRTPMRLCPHHMLIRRCALHGICLYSMPPYLPPLEITQGQRIRHCAKDSKDCKGKGGRNCCTNAGEMDCRVRNSRQPEDL